MTVRDDDSSMRSLRFFTALGLVTVSIGFLYAAASADWEAAGKAWWKHVEYLASDELQGRNVGSPGYEKAAKYVAKQFAEAGLKPAGGSGYFQAVEFIETSIDPKQSSLYLVHGSEATAVAVPGEAQLGYSESSTHSLEAPVVFAGYGLVIPEAQYNDLRDLPVKELLWRS